jgi:hypothetical protein
LVRPLWRKAALRHLQGRSVLSDASKTAAVYLV